jgi:hypothetical protein
MRVRRIGVLKITVPARGELPSAFTARVCAPPQHHPALLPWRSSPAFDHDGRRNDRGRTEIKMCTTRLLR